MRISIGVNGWIWDFPAFRIPQAERRLLSKSDVQRLPHQYDRGTEGEQVAEQSVLAGSGSKLLVGFQPIFASLVTALNQNCNCKNSHFSRSSLAAAPARIQGCLQKPDL